MSTNVGHQEKDKKQMYFEDLSPYSYDSSYGPDRVIPLDEIRMIGWLENGHVYTQGQVDTEILFKLRKLIVMANSIRIQYRGYHFCDFCPAPDERDLTPKIEFEGKQVNLGSAQFWLPSATSPDMIYAAPNLIYHYIVEHDYLPPQEFLDAVNRFDMDSTWDAGNQRRIILEKHRERLRKAEQAAE